MYYNVVARFKPEAAAEFRSKLLDGTIESQKPDGREIVASMNRAVVNAAGEVVWSETCYCATPLEHERKTVYDHFFTGLTTTEVDGYQEHAGEPFMRYLEQLAGGPTPPD